MFVKTEFVRKSSASHTLQCYSNRNEFLEHYPRPTDRIETESESDVHRDVVSIQSVGRG